MARTSAHIACLAALLTALLPVAARADSQEIPFRYTDGFIRVSVSVAGSAKPLSMLLDSGASASLLNLRTARALRLKLKGVVPVNGVSADSEAREIGPLSAEIGVCPAGAIALAADMSAADKLCAAAVDGLIGVDFFRDRIVRIDYSRERIELLDTSPARGMNAIRLPIKVLNDVACVPVGVNGSSPRFTRLDTGFNDCLHWVIPRRISAERQQRASIGFVTNESDVVSATVVLGGKRISAIPTVIHGSAFFPGEAGLLGNGILSRYRVTIDWPASQVMLEPVR